MSWVMNGLLVRFGAARRGRPRPRPQTSRTSGSESSRPRLIKSAAPGADCASMWRQRSGSSLCYACGKLNRVDASVCFYCGARQPGLWGFGPALGRVVGRLDVTHLIIAVCIVAYVASVLVDPGAALRPRGVFDILAPSTRALYALGAAGTLPWAEGRWWTILTAIYLHGSLLHILFNLMWVRQLGPSVEELFGGSRLFAIFTVAGAV